MPWVKSELCSGCTVCVGLCPATAISIREDMKAWIHEEKCIHCGICRESCPQGAVRPDCERLASDVKTHVRKIRSVMRRVSSPAVQERSLRCIVDHYRAQKRLAETTLRELAVLYGRARTKTGSSLKAADGRMR